jgi:O-antigen/teichoic acid export membrane protein
MAAHTVAAVVAVGVAVWLLGRARPSASRDNIAFPAGLSRYWTTSALSFGFIAAVQAINGQATIVVLGLLRPAADVGIYQVAAQASAVLSFGLVALNIVCAPQYTRFCAQRDLRRLQGVAVHSARASLGVAGVGFLLLILFGDRILSLFFGPEFRAAYGIMVILSCAQLVNVAVGSVGILLGMSGHERLLARVTAISAALNIVLSVALIEGYGREGAGIAAATSIIFVNVVLWRMVQVKLGVDSSVLGSVGTRTAARMGNAD